MLAETTVLDILQNPLNLFIIVIVGVPVVFGLWYQWKSHRDKLDVKHAELMLKQSMIERGMSADEIERVLAAGSDDAASVDANE